MLDDFKTELKRLGIKRIQKEEKRRQSFALVLDDKDPDDDANLEFADALNTNPARFYGKNALDRTNTANTADSPPRRLRQDSLEMNGSADKRGAPKSAMGKSGLKIGQLPGLKKFGFESIKPGKKDKSDPDDDLENQSPTAAPTGKSSQEDSSDPSSSTERVTGMRKSLGAIDPSDFQTKPSGY